MEFLLSYPIQLLGEDPAWNSVYIFVQAIVCGVTANQLSDRMLYRSRFKPVAKAVLSILCIVSLVSLTLVLAMAFGSFNFQESFSNMPVNEGLVWKSSGNKVSSSDMQWTGALFFGAITLAIVGLLIWMPASVIGDLDK